MYHVINVQYKETFQLLCAILINVPTEYHMIRMNDHNFLSLLFKDNNYEDMFYCSTGARDPLNNKSCYFV